MSMHLFRAFQMPLSMYFSLKNDLWVHATLMYLRKSYHAGSESTRTTPALVQRYPS